MAKQVNSREATARDVALAVDLNQQYIDILEEMIDSDLTFRSPAVTVRVDGQRIKFQDIGDVATWITSR